MDDPLPDTNTTADNNFAYWGIQWYIVRESKIAFISDALGCLNGHTILSALLLARLE